jgi:hypothetical protein
MNRYNCFSINQLKNLFLMDAFVDILTYELQYNMICTKTLYFLFLSKVLFFVNYDCYDYIVFKSNQCLFQVFYMHYKF